MKKAQPDHHLHKCKHCDTIWEHHDKCSQLVHTNKEEYKKAHRCPKCNRPSLKKYQ